MKHKNRPSGTQGPHRPPHDPASRRATVISATIFIALIVVIVLSASGAFSGHHAKSITTSEFLSAVEEDRISSATYSTASGELTGDYWESTDDVGDQSKLEQYKSTYVGTDNLDNLMQTHKDIQFNVNTDSNDMLVSALFNLIPTLLIIGVMIYFINQIQGQNNQAMSFSHTEAKMTEAQRPNVTFKDVAGIDEAVEELTEIRDFLRDPDRYHKMGARIPRGVLLVGPPGTGKTLLAKAVAGEAGVPFFSISGSDFVEMFVGVGASRVRDLFKQAKEAAPSIIFIDEIDAVGRQRGAGLGGGHDEREQTLNQLLVEMDGFEENEAVILIAATNRPDILDPALLRPGRFDRQVTVDRPDVRGREKILKVHAQGKPLDKTVIFASLAKMTPGFTGADLANLMNEAALLAARRHKAAIGEGEIEEAMERTIAGPERKTRVMTEQERTTIAYHESGHALVGHVLERSDPVHKISIVSRGQALGYTMQLPTEDHYLESKNSMLDQIAVLLGGRTAEELCCSDITTGASNDLERATKLARQMVTRYGMSTELGAQVFGEAQHQVFLGRDYADHQDYSAQTAKRIDDEVERIMCEAHKRARKVLSRRKDQLDLMKNVLLERETVSGDALEALLDNKWDTYLESHPKEAKPALENNQGEDTAAEPDSAGGE